MYTYIVFSIVFVCVCVSLSLSPSLNLSRKSPYQQEISGARRLASSLTILVSRRSSCVCAWWHLPVWTFPNIVLGHMLKAFLSFLLVRRWCPCFSLLIHATSIGQDVSRKVPGNRHRLRVFLSFCWPSFCSFDRFSRPASSMTKQMFLPPNGDTPHKALMMIEHTHARMC